MSCTLSRPSNYAPNGCKPPPFATQATIRKSVASHAVRTLFALVAIALATPVVNAQLTKQQKAERLNRMVFAALAAGDYEEAVARGHEHVDLLPDSHLSPYNLACAYALLGDRGNSVKWLKIAAKK